MPQWVELPPNLVSCNETKGKSIYRTDYSSKRPGFQIHLQKARGADRSHHPKVPKEPSRTSMRASQTGDYINFKKEFERSLTSQSPVARSPGLQLKMSLPAGTPQTTGSEVYREVLSDYMKPSLDLVRQSWKGETSAVKRDRDRMYGLAGKKVDLVPRLPKEEQSKKMISRVLPGMKNWLSSSNEYEKAVVYNFIDHVSKATDKKPIARPTTPHATKPKFANEYYYRQRAKSARSQRITDRPQLPPRPQTVSSFRPDDKVQETTEENWAREKEQPIEHEHGHFDHVHHTEGKCEFCDYYRVKTLLEYLNRQDPSLGDATLRYLLRPKMDPRYNYPSYDDFDYMHENSFFTFTSARDRGYFIIAPDWVSERKGIKPLKYRS